MHVLVTGGLGFLGHAVALDLLAAGHRVTVLSRGRTDRKPAPGADLVTGDLRDRAGIAAVVRTGSYDGVVHLAALTSGRDSLANPLTYFNVNATGTLHLLMALDSVRDRAAPASFVLASTNIVYGSQRSGTLSEDLEVHPESPYGASKVAAEQMVAGYAATGAFGAMTVRPFNVAGAVDGIADTDPVRLIPNVFRAMTGQIDYLTLNGDGSAVRDFVHIADVATGIRLALDACTPGTHHVLNLASGVGTSMAGVIAAAEQVTGRSVAVRQRPPKPEPSHLVGEISRARALLGWEPACSGLTRMITDGWTAWQRLG
ncbi:NAD-dependent epimerase/dehydratase family protein [Micromonospora antibiotica]|uniref:UDP-glucose 4-epimerase n=1 Tax=Micromonospora antibiotica TaxID=2807623 RepID=A0ABS3V1T9_9ACTN|nr:NAD-dependent epimerase/dehydratase family protein [Micromonospora antibiotica]MBO4159580.1 UDP-glucose 4-epimerase [Micromonospora antibiotica]